MGRAIELRGDGKWHETLWSGKVFCPMSNKETLSTSCPKRKECRLPEVDLRADNYKQAVQFIKDAAVDGKLSKCLNGKPYSTGINKHQIVLYPSVEDSDYWELNWQPKNELTNTSPASSPSASPSASGKTSARKTRR
ncbi:MAG: hypothetical protein Q7K55_01745 [Candidatus Levybacteria bacterium]|nr:hypothetical protein [Candidatus Levybacteria bacterium]